MKKSLFLNREGLNVLKQKIQLHMKPKIINGKVLNAGMLFNLALEYVEALNNETAPNIYSTLERIIHSETRKVCDDVMIEFYDRVRKKVKPSCLILHNR